MQTRYSVFIGGFMTKVAEDFSGDYMTNDSEEDETTEYDNEPRYSERDIAELFNQYQQSLGR